MFRNKFNFKSVVIITIYLAGSATIFAQGEIGVIIGETTWATRNVDAPGIFAKNSEDAGMYYQWNSKVGWTVAGVPSDGTSVWNGDWYGGNVAITTWEAANDPCPIGWRIPTAAELISLGEGIWTTNGREFGNETNIIFLPAAGMINTYRTYMSMYHYYWSSNSYSSSGLASAMNITSSTVMIEDDFGRAGAFCVRCVKDDSDTGINPVSVNTKNATVIGYFDILGRKLRTEPTAGIYIIQYDNGTAKKVMK